MMYAKRLWLGALLTLGMTLGCGVQESYQSETDHHISTNEPVVLKLYDGYNRGRPEKKGEVRKLQSMLKELGYVVDVDGFYGPGTVAAIERFQRRYGLIVVGETVFKSTYELIVKSVAELRGINPPVPKVDIMKSMTRTSKRKGMKNGYPIYWNVSSHKDKFKATYGSEQAYYRVYSDLWTMKELNKTLKGLNKLGVVGVNHLGSYNYRNVSGTGSRSRHSYGLAFDIRGFYMKDGSFVSVLDHWKHPAKGKTLRQIRDTFCANWDVVLSPDYNAAHRDHFHVDLDPGLRNKFETRQPVWRQLPTSLTAGWSGLYYFDDFSEELEEEHEHAHEAIDYKAINAQRQMEYTKWSVSTRSFCR